jgi:Uncharacterized protein conserved in bacteria (DUF2330)
MLKRFAILVSALALFVLQSHAALACGGLVAPDGDIRLERATTLVAWHNGIEHYMTSFTYQENNAHSGANLGWIVPLPAVPIKIEEGGAWTLQRLFRETHPEPTPLFAADNAATSSAGVEVLQQVKVEALNITVLRGSGQAVLNWATGNGFFLNGDTRAHLLAYATGSPIFMAAKYDTAAAKARHQIQGDGAPVLITMKIPHPWVPLEVLALDGQQVQADIYFLTDMPISTSDVKAKIGQSAVGSEVPGAPGLQLAYQEQVNPTLFHDLSTDRNMGWVPQGSWLTYLSLNAPDTAVTYDLGVSSSGVIRIAPFGTPPMAVVDGQHSHDLPGWLPTLPLGTPQTVESLAFLLGIGVLAYLIFRARARRARTHDLAQ